MSCSYEVGYRAGERHAYEQERKVQAKLCEAWPLVLKLLEMVDDLPSPKRNDSASFKTEVHELDLCDCHDAAKRLREALQ